MRWDRRARKSRVLRPGARRVPHLQGGLPPLIRAWLPLLLVSAATSGISACSHCTDSSQDEVVVYTSVDQVFSEPIFQQCEQQVGGRVRAVFDTEETKSTGVLNRLIAEAAHPQADLFWSGDPVRPFVLIDRGMVAPYQPQAAAGIPASFRASDGTWTGFAARARVLLVNKTRVSEDQIPHSIRDMTDKKWRGQTAIANPLFGTTTIHVAALFTAWGDNDAKRFMNALKENRVRIASSNGEVKRLVATGEVAFGLADTDDAFEALESGAPIEVVYPDQDGMGTLIMPTVAVLLKGSPHPEQGKRLVDCLVSARVEEQLAKTAAHIPLRPGVLTPPGVKPASAIRAMSIDYARVAETMTRIEPWLRTWAGL